MGKGPKNRNKRSPNYFKTNAQQFGEDFLQKKNPLDIRCEKNIYRYDIWKY